MDFIDYDHSMTLFAAQAAFLKVRDIPYAAQYQLLHSDDRLRTIKGQGCTLKARHLQCLLNALAIPSELRYVQFRWSAVLEGLPGVPKQLLMAAGALGPRWHVFLSVRFSSGIINIDPTWDAGLRHLGFPVNTRMEPPHDMILAVPPEGLIVHDPGECLHLPGLSHPTESPQANNSALASYKHYYVFVLHFNRWLENGRAAADRPRCQCVT